ncbi:hypothetical protein FJ651_13630 [Paucihalobacter ruber]|uniref:DUF4397 domain-containing protein n=1 Tax=Paucihalobacter ruber TaxID=2567861 RepID=A0A506PFK1_9FLAO|nr:hypothetical protein [Paucihalobacter ruber]TPV31857.1 hypothetical protein FJ651_13630 [Paucihalobacter ruber]
MKTTISVLLFFVTFCGFSQVGINTDTPLSMLDINGNLSLKVVTLNGGSQNNATPINDGIYINLIPTVNNLEFILPDADAVPGRIYILRNITNNLNAEIYSFDGGFFSGDSRLATTISVTDLTPRVIMAPDADNNGGDITKTLIFISDGNNWTYGRLGL